MRCLPMQLPADGVSPAFCVRQGSSSLRFSSHCCNHKPHQLHSRAQPSRNMAMLQQKAATRFSSGNTACTTRNPTLLCIPNHQRVARGRSLVALAGSSGSDPFFTLTPFEMMDRQMAMMDKQMELMTRQMDSEMGRMMSMSRDIESQAARQVEEALRQARQAEASANQAVRNIEINEPGLQIRRSEERGTNSYRYYESISVTSYGPRYYSSTAVATAAGPSPLLIVAMLLAGAYAAFAAAFARNWHLTTFTDESKWRLALMWPILLITSPKFRQQFWSAVRGKASTEDDANTLKQ